jgi:hypothetical protein
MREIGVLKYAVVVFAIPYCCKKPAGKTLREALNKLRVVPQGLKPAIILLDLMYGLKPVPFKAPTYSVVPQVSPAGVCRSLALFPCSFGPLFS